MAWLQTIAPELNRNQNLLGNWLVVEPAPIHTMCTGLDDMCGCPLHWQIYRSKCAALQQLPEVNHVSKMQIVGHFNFVLSTAYQEIPCILQHVTGYAAAQIEGSDCLNINE
jgi:hypothetical protein